VHDQRCADRTAGDDLFEGPVGLVVAAHEPHLHEPAAESHLGLQDAQAGILGGGERLLAEDWLPGIDAGQDVLLVRAAPGGHDDGVDPAIMDQLQAGREHPGTLHAFGHAAGAVHVDVGDGHDLGTGQHLGQPADVILPDHADTDDPDLDDYSCSPFAGPAAGTLTARSAM
jgi:hypothetical protein